MEFVRHQTTDRLTDTDKLMMKMLFNYFLCALTLALFIIVCCHLEVVVHRFEYS